MAVKLNPATDINPPKGRRPVPANCRVDELQVDAAYQREMGRESEVLIRAIAKDWDWSLCQPLIVARRPDDTLWVVDGQHRLTAARLRGDILDLPAVIIHYGDAQAEAQAFVALNTARRPLSPYAVWRAAIAGGDAAAIALSDLLARHNLTPTGNANRVTWKPGMIGSISKLLRMQATHGVPHLDRVLGALVSAFGDEPLIHGPILITAISALMLQTDVDDEEMVRILRGKNQNMWARAFTARMATTGDGYQVAAIAVLRFAAFPAPPANTPPQQPAPSPQPQPAAKPRLSHEEQLALVRSGAATISEKLVMPRGDVAGSSASSLA